MEDELPQLDIVNIQQTPKPKLKKIKAKLMKIWMMQTAHLIDATDLSKHNF